MYVPEIASEVNWIKIIQPWNINIAFSIYGILQKYSQSEIVFLKLNSVHTVVLVLSTRGLKTLKVHNPATYSCACPKPGTCSPVVVVVLLVIYCSTVNWWEAVSWTIMPYFLFLYYLKNQIINKIWYEIFSVSIV